MLRVNFVFDRRKEAAKKGKGQIELRLFVSGEVERYLATGILITPNQWDKKKGAVSSRHTDAINVNLQLSRLKEKAETFYRAAGLDGRKVSAEDVKNHVAGKTKPTDDFIRFVAEEIGKEEETGRLKQSTLKQHRVFLGYLEDIYGSLPFDSIDYSFLIDLRRTLLNSPGRRAQKLIADGRTFKPGVEKLEVNYVANLFKIFDRYVKEARRRGRIKSDPFELFTIDHEEKPKRFLVWEEVERFATAPVTGRYRNIEESRRRFLFCVYTGLRFSDSCALRVKNLTWTEEGLRLVFTPVKTEKHGTAVNLPLYALFFGRPEKIAFEIMRGKAADDFLFGPVDLSTYNGHIKAICKAAGLQPATAHTARHSAGMILANKFNLRREEIQAVLGHTDIATTGIYSRLQSTSLDEAIKRAFDK